MKKGKRDNSVAHTRHLSTSQRSGGKYLKLKSCLALFLFSLLSPFALCGKLQTVCGTGRAHFAFVFLAPLMEHVIIAIIITPLSHLLALRLPPASISPPCRHVCVVLCDFCMSGPSKHPNY